MAIHIEVQEDTSRSIAINAETHKLVFKHNEWSSQRGLPAKPSPPQCTVEFSPIAKDSLTKSKTIESRPIYGTLGLINVGLDVFLCVITQASRVATLRPGETVQRILSVEFYCLNTSRFDQITWAGPAHQNAYNAVDGDDNSILADSAESQIEHPCQSLKKILSSGSFYFSSEFDLTSRLQNRDSDKAAFDLESFDPGFLWNSYMIAPLVKFRSRLALQAKKSLDDTRILTSAIRGYVASVIVPASSSILTPSGVKQPGSLSLVSRLSCRRAGTRFNSRGIDDDGNVANFVETETVFWTPGGYTFSYSQVRGSVPIFWEQSTGLLPHQQKIQITRSAEATQPAFDRHFEGLELKYGNVHVLDLLSAFKAGEAELTAQYQAHISQSSLNQGRTDGGESQHILIEYSHYDFHAETKDLGYEAARSIQNLISNQAQSFMYYLSTNSGPIHNADHANKSGMTVVLQQEGIFRTNCLDCLDRTNLVQTLLSQLALEILFGQLKQSSMADFWARHSTLWADNGDALSKIYAGTGALKSSFTRHGKMSFAGALADARKSATRMYINNFVDKSRQNVIDTLLGRLVDQSPVELHDPINDYVSRKLADKINEYSTTDEIGIWVGTFNLNGRGAPVKEDLSAWLRPQSASAWSRADIVAVGFQEIVELSPQQMMSTDPSHRREWEIAVSRTLNTSSSEKIEGNEFVMLRSGQLVGTALIIFVRRSHLNQIKNVEGSIKKTGLSGMAGNKGAVAIRMEFANTRICFVTAHLAAGFANFNERNQDFQTINRGLRFQGNRSIDDHDNIIWLGDFNYRIGLGNETVRRAIDARDLENLYRNDQLSIQMIAGNAFRFYHEAKINFLPTYKYNNGTDEYDTSEKARIPAWCDRVLWKSLVDKNLVAHEYSTAPLRFSDHRPVFATFTCTVRIDDEAKKSALSDQLYESRRRTLEQPSPSSFDAEFEGEDDTPPLRRPGEGRGGGQVAGGSAGGVESMPGMPPASSDRRKWWIDNGHLARSEIAAQNQGRTPNPNRPANPFTASSEPDWID